MIFGRITRFLRRHRQAFLVWAVMPLALVDTQALVGCGCSGHFESTCQCGSCDSSTVGPAALTAGSPRCGPNASHCRHCCAGAKSTSPRQQRGATLLSHNGNDLGTHRCQQLTVRIGGSIVAVTAQASHDDAVGTMVPVDALPVDHTAHV